MADIFISYTRNDSEIMERIRDGLLDSNITPWTDENLIPGSADWENSVTAAIWGCHALAVILTPNSQRSEWVRREITMAEEIGVPIYPLLGAGIPIYVVPLRLRNHNHYDFRENFEESLERLVDALNNAFEFNDLHNNTKTSIRSARGAVRAYFRSEYNDALEEVFRAFEQDANAEITMRIYYMITNMLSDMVELR